MAYFHISKEYIPESDIGVPGGPALEGAVSSGGSSGSSSSTVTQNTINISTNETNITNNTNDISTNTTNISINETNITNNTNDISTNTSNISTNTNDITNLTSTVSQNSSDIVALQSGSGAPGGSFWVASSSFVGVSRISYYDNAYSANLVCINTLDDSGVLNVHGQDGALPTISLTGQNSGITLEKYGVGNSYIGYKYLVSDASTDNILTISCDKSASATSSISFELDGNQMVHIKETSIKTVYPISTTAPSDYYYHSLTCPNVGGYLAKNNVGEMFMRVVPDPDNSAYAMSQIACTQHMQIVLNYSDGGFMPSQPTYPHCKINGEIHSSFPVDSLYNRVDCPSVGGYMITGNTSGGETYYRLSSLNAQISCTSGDIILQPKAAGGQVVNTGGGVARSMTFSRDNDADVLIDGDIVEELLNHRTELLNSVSTLQTQVADLLARMTAVES